MSAFLSLHGSGFWLVVSLLCTVALLAAQPFLPENRRTTLVLANWLIIPYLALIVGGVSPRLMGLLFLDWPAGLRLGAGLLLAVIALAAVARFAAGAGSTPPTSSAIARQPSSPIAVWRAVLAAIGWCGAEEFHWCFLRGAIWETALSLPQPIELPAYWSIWVAALLALPGILVLQPTGPKRVVKIAILVVTSVIFFYTRNFWLCWAVHAATWLLLTPVTRNSIVRTEPTPRVQ